MDGVIGFTTLFAGNFAPRNWAFCNGQLMSVAQYPALFQVLSNKYGGDGKSTFALPNLQGRAVVSAGQAPGLSQYNLGQQGGSESTVIYANNMPAHTHKLEVQLVSATSATANTASPANAAYATSASNLYNYEPNTELQAYTGTLTLEATGYDPLNTPPAVPYLHPVLGINYIICLNGVFPG